MDLKQHLYSEGPKRILSLDGGGIRGALTSGFLLRIEKILREQNGNDKNFRLCDYFDLIGGTSTGSIIAAGLATGMSVEEIKEKYFELGAIIFGRKYRWWNPFELVNFLRGGFNEKPLEEILHAIFGDLTMGSQQLKTGLCIITKRADTNSLWPIMNHPGGRYFDSIEGNNKDIPVWKAVRASTAAPTYFIPQLIEVGGGMPQAAFIDGAVSMANNPALQLLMVATLGGYPFRWKLGAENLLLVSVGTGLSAISKPATEIKRYNLFRWAKDVPEMLMQDANWQNQLMLQWLSRSATTITVDGEIGDMKDDLLSTDSNSKGLLTYLRYNVLLNQSSLKKIMNKEYAEKVVADLVDMSNPKSRFELYEIGKTAGSKEIQHSHFPEYFKLSAS